MIVRLCLPCYKLAEMSNAMPQIDRQTQARALLGSARERIRHGDGPAALTELLQAVQVIWGEQGSIATVQRFRESFAQHAQNVNDLSAMVSQLEAITISPGDVDESMQQDEAVSTEIRQAGEQPIIAAQLENMSAVGLHNLANAQANSYVCDMCGGVVAISRRQQHLSQWCPALSAPGTSS